MKECRDCKSLKPLEDFSPSSKNKDGRTSYCRTCMRQRSVGYRERAARASGREVRQPVPVADGFAHCAGCSTVKPLTDFGRRTGPRSGRTAYCRSCHNERSKESRDRLHGGSRNYHLQRRYGITAAEADAMLEAQGGLCAICRERPAEHVDHDHLTGKVRALLCFCCNQGLGNFRDRADVMRAAIAYLEAHSWQKRRIESGVYALVHPAERDEGRTAQP